MPRPRSQPRTDDVPTVTAPVTSPPARPVIASILDLLPGPQRALVVEGAGAYVGKHSERLRVSLKQEVLQEVPLLNLEHLVLVGRGISISSDAVALCMEYGVAIDYVSDRDQPVASLYPAVMGATVRTRRQQLMAFGDERGVHLALAFAYGKLRNQARLLRYLAKNRKERLPAAFERAAATALQIEGMARQVQKVQGGDADAVRQAILTLEGRAAEMYWTAARALLLADVDWENRTTRGATDPVNSALNYGYALLYGQVQRAVVLAGLDPFAGFLHVDRPGKPSLVLDMVEEFRQMVVDRCIFALFNQGVALWDEEEGLTRDGRRAIVDRVRERLDGAEIYQGKRYAVRIIIQAQARRVASYVRGDYPEYLPYIGRW